MINTFLKFLYSYKFTIFIFILFLLIAFIPIHFAFSIPMLLMVGSFLCILNILAKTKYSLPFSIIFTLVIAFNAYVAFVYGSEITMGMIASFFETNKAEVLSMGKAAVIPAILVLTATIALILFSQKELKSAKRFSLRLSIVGLLLYLLAFLPFICYRRIKSQELERLVSEFPLLVGQNIINMYAPVLYGNIITYAAYNNEMRMLREFAQDYDKPLPEGITLQKQAKVPEKIFLVIGESSFRRHYSLYGYNIKTTPFLDSLALENPSPLNFYDGIAAAPFTRDAVRIALSFATPLDLQPFYHYKMLVNMANEAGYETIWISNQGKTGIEDSYLGYIAAAAKHTFFEDRGYLTQDDMQLIPIINEYYNDSTKQFIVVHLTGSHVKYSDRYDKIDENAIQNKDALTADYDRSIHHTDRVLNKIYQFVKKDSSSVLYYFSDHGESVKLGHGSKRAGIDQFEIPILTISNDSTYNANKIISQYLDSQNKHLNNSSTILILAQLMGYSIPHKYIQQSIEEGKYILHVDAKSYLFDDMKK